VGGVGGATVVVGASVVVGGGEVVVVVGGTVVGAEVVGGTVGRIAGRVVLAVVAEIVVFELDDVDDEQPANRAAAKATGMRIERFMSRRLSLLPDRFGQEIEIRGEYPLLQLFPQVYP
jgi:hypothetical protein